MNSRVAYALLPQIVKDTNADIVIVKSTAIYQQCGQRITELREQFG